MPASSVCAPRSHTTAPPIPPQPIAVESSQNYPPRAPCAGRDRRQPGAGGVGKNTQAAAPGKATKKA